MELLTISQVSKAYDISARMLRYYEQIGLVKSGRKEENSYRVYDEVALKRIQQIIILRKLQIPVKQICVILENPNTAAVIELFRNNIADLDREITALSTIKSVLNGFVRRLEEITTVHLNLDLLSDDSVLKLTKSLSLVQKNVKESISMEELSKASEKLNRLADGDVRIIYLPPMSVAAAYASGENCEGKAGDMVKQFVNDSGLLKIKPDARSFGFDCSQGATGIGEPSHVYEVWVSVPDDMEIPAPLIKREFTGGLYAAHVLKSWDFSLWGLLNEWVATSVKFDNDWGSSRWASEETVFGQGFEETLNYYHFAQDGCEMQLDLLFPIKERK